MAQCYGRTKNLNRCQRQRNWKFFCKEHKWQPVMLCLSLLAIAGSVASIYAVAVSNTRAPIEWSPSPGGQAIQKATLAGLDRELQDAATQNKSAAKLYFEVAEHDFSARRYLDAANNYQKSLDLLPTMSAYLNLGTALLYTPNIQAAENAFLRGAEIASTKRDRGFQGTFLVNLGFTYQSQGELDQAFASFQAALELAKQTGNLSTQTMALGYLALNRAFQGKGAEALMLAHEALELAKQTRERNMQAHALTCLGFTYAMQGKLAAALKAFQESHMLAKQIGNLPNQSLMLHAFGIVYHGQGHLGKALTTFQAALKLIESLGTGDPLLQSVILTSISITYLEMSLYSDGSSDLRAQLLAKARTAGQTALDLAQQIGAPIIEVGALESIGLIHAMRGEMAEAFTALRRGLEFARQLSIVPLQIEALINIGFVHLTQAQWVEALAPYQAALELAEQSDYLGGQAAALTAIGIIRDAQGKHREALEILTQASTLYQTLGNQTRRQRVEGRIKALYQHLNHEPETRRKPLKS